MSARAWERRRANKRERMLRRRIGRAFGVGHLVGKAHAGSYALMVDWEMRVLRPVMERIIEARPLPEWDLDAEHDPRGRQDVRDFLAERLGTWT